MRSALEGSPLRHRHRPPGSFESSTGVLLVRIHGGYTTPPATQIEERHSVALILAQKALLKYFHTKRAALSYGARYSAMQNKFLKNNFDLIRLFAAFQVALVHVFRIMEIETAWVGSFILHLFYLFPGVPIFFFISGFLISRSYENNSCFTGVFH